MNLDFADILLKVVKHKASDLHITAGAPPMLRIRGSLVAAGGHAEPDADRHARDRLRDPQLDSQRQRLETDWQLDFAYSVPGVGRFRVNAYFQRGTLGAAFRLIPSETVPIEKLGLPLGRARVRQEAARDRARHRADRLRQVDRRSRR